MEGFQRIVRSNVEICLLHFLRDVHEFEPKSLDFVLLERGPIGYESYGIQSALTVL